MLRAPPHEKPLAPPRASLGGNRMRARTWRCCGVAWGGSTAYDAHLRWSHGGDRAAHNAEGGSGQGVEPIR
jgi:hypothetical protein